MRYSHHAPLAAFVGLALATSVGLSLNARQSTEKLAKAQVVACQKANELRVESNQRIRSHLVLREAAEDALKAQATARLADYRASRRKADLVAHRSAKVLLRRIENEVRYDETPVLSCKDLVPF